MVFQLYAKIYENVAKVLVHEVHYEFKTNHGILFRILYENVEAYIQVSSEIHAHLLPTV